MFPVSALGLEDEGQALTTCRRKLSLYEDARTRWAAGIDWQVVCLSQSAEHNWCPRQDQITASQQEIKRRSQTGPRLRRSIFLFADILHGESLVRASCRESELKSR